MAKVRIPKNELTEFDLPRVCVVTGATERVDFFPVSFQFIPRWSVIFYLFCGPIGYFVAMMLLRKTAAGKLPFTTEAHARMKQTRVIVALAIVGLLVVGIGGGVALGSTMSGDSGPLAILVTIVVAVLAIIPLAIYSRKLGPACVEIDDVDVTLDLPSEEAARQIESRLRVGAKATGETAKVGPFRDPLDEQIDRELKA